MGANKERLERLNSNRSSFNAIVVRAAQSTRLAVAAASTDEASASALKAARTEGFEGAYGDDAAAALVALHKEIDKFGAHQAALSKAIDAANQALQDAADKTGELPGVELTSDQRDTVTTARGTNSPVQVSPGVMMTSAEAKQYYLDQAAAEQEEAAAKVTAALDATLQDIMNSMPVSDYDEPEPTPDPSGDDGTGDNPQVDNPGVNGSGNGVVTGGGGSGSGVTGGTNGNGDNSGTIVGPPFVYDPPRVDPPVIEDPRWPDTDGTDGTDDPNVDGGIDGVVPGTGGTGGTVGYPGGGTGGGMGGTGSVGGGLSGVLGGAAGSAGALGLANRLGGGAGLLGGAGGVGGVGGAGSASGAGASGVVGQSGAANGGRGGVMAGGAAAGGGAGAGGRSDKRNRRRGQDLMAFQVEPDDDDIAPDLGAAGSAGRASSDGREELTW